MRGCRNTTVIANEDSELVARINKRLCSSMLCFNAQCPERFGSRSFQAHKPPGKLQMQVRRISRSLVTSLDSSLLQVSDIEYRRDDYATKVQASRTALVGGK